MFNFILFYIVFVFELNFLLIFYFLFFVFIVSFIVKFMVNIVFNKDVVVCFGIVNVKEEGLRVFMWSKRWLVLRNFEFCIYKNEVRFCNMVSLFISFCNMNFCVNWLF